MHEHTHTHVTCGFYLKHVRVFVMAVFHHHGLVPGQCVGDTVLAFAVHSLVKIKKKERERGNRTNYSQCIFIKSRAEAAINSQRGAPSRGPRARV